MSGLKLHIVLLVCLLGPVAIAIQNVIMLFVVEKSYQEMYDTFKKNGLESWDTSAMLIMYFSGCLTSPVYLFCLKDLAPKITTFLSLYNDKLKNLILSGGMPIIVHIINTLFLICNIATVDIERCCSYIDIWYILLTIFGILSTGFATASFSIGLIWSLFPGTLLRTNDFQQNISYKTFQRN